MENKSLPKKMWLVWDVSSAGPTFRLKYGVASSIFEDEFGLADAESNYPIAGFTTVGDIMFCESNDENAGKMVDLLLHWNKENDGDLGKLKALYFGSNATCSMPDRMKWAFVRKVGR